MLDKWCSERLSSQSNDVHQSTGGKFIHNAGEQLTPAPSQRYFIKVVNKLDDKEDFMQKMILQAMQELQELQNQEKIEWCVITRTTLNDN